MPHLILEYSANVLEDDSFGELFEKCHGLLADSLPTERKSCVSRAIECTQYCVGEGRGDSAFIHVNLKVKAGRTFEVLKKTAEVILEAIKSHCHESMQQLNLKITMEVNELTDNYFTAS